MRQHRIQTARARNLRQRQTEAERILWLALRDRRLAGLKFRRQVPLGPWTADFYCASARLVVEADGGRHGACADHARDAWMAAEGLTVLRFWNPDTRDNLPGVLQRICEEAER